MKTKIISITLATVLMFSAVGVFAGSQDPRIRLEQAGKNVLHLYMDSLDQSAKFTIYDEFRHTLYEETSEKLVDYKKRFDLSKLPDGEYSFEIEYGQKFTIYSFEVKKHVVVISSDVTEYFKPTILFENDLLGISLLNPKAGEVSITLIDPNGNTLVSDELIEKQLVAIRYNLSQLPLGNYLLVVKTADRTYKENLSL